MPAKTLKLLKVFLVLVTAHSFCVGLGLILIPLEFFDIFGFQGYSGNFFKVQAGVFHVVLCVAYLLGAMDPVGNRNMILFAVSAKMIATVFLLSYAVFIDLVWMVMASGAFDFLMGLVLVWFNRKLRPEQV